MTGNTPLRWITLLALVVIGIASTRVQAQTPLEGTTIQSRSELPHDNGFVSRNDSVSLLITAMGPGLQRAVIVSKSAERKRVSGSFDLSDPMAVLREISGKLGLIWYDDQQSIYIYDAWETRSAVRHLEHASIATLDDFLRKANLADPRYPVRGVAGPGTFYISGPPVYVDIVLNAARYIDSIYRGADNYTQHIEVIALQHSFVSGRRYSMRDRVQQLPGLADVLQSSLSSQGVASVIRSEEAPMGVPLPESDQRSSTEKDPAHAPSAESSIAGAATKPQSGEGALTIFAYQEANSLVVRGTLGEIQKVKQLVAELDRPRKQIELSLWIIDIKRAELDRLGVAWSASAGVGGLLGVTYNAGNMTTLDGKRFLASISALSQKGDATIVSRPVLLTQENIMAHFDSSQTMYVSLIGERTTALESVTFGTLVSVLPRTSGQSEVEMQLRIEDGSASPSAGESGALPVVSRTTIDTVARVPHQLSLLIGGYSRDVDESGRAHVPGVGRLPVVGGLFRHKNRRTDSVVRMFLIQPRLLDERAPMNAAEARKALDVDPELSLPGSYQSIRQLRDVLRGNSHGH